MAACQKTVCLVQDNRGIPGKSFERKPRPCLQASAAVFICFLECCRQEYEASGDKDLPNDRLISFIVKAFTTGHSKEEYQAWIKQAGLNPDWGVGAQERVNRLKEYQGQIGAVIRQPIARAYPTDKELKSRHLYPIGAPVIYLTNCNEMLAQMCIFAYRQHEAQDCISYLRDYVKAVLCKDNLDVVNYLLGNWGKLTTPPSRENFNTYIKKVAAHKPAMAGMR